MTEADGEGSFGSAFENSLLKAGKLLALALCAREESKVFSDVQKFRLK